MRKYVIPLLAVLAFGACKSAEKAPDKKDFKTDYAVELASVDGVVAALCLVRDVDKDDQVDIIAKGGGDCFYAPGYENHCPPSSVKRYMMDPETRSMATHALINTQGVDYRLANIKHMAETLSKGTSKK